MKKTFLYGVITGILVIFTLPELFTVYSMNGDESRLTLLMRIMGLSQETYSGYTQEYIVTGRLVALGLLVILGLLFVLIRFIYLKFKSKKITQ